MPKVDLNTVNRNPEDAEQGNKPQKAPAAPANTVRILKSYDGRIARKGERCRVDTTNEEYAANPDFKAACDAAGIPATRRQASKYRMGKGRAYASKHRLAKAA